MKQKQNEKSLNFNPVIPEIGKKYKHYKKGIYTVVDIRDNTVYLIKDKGASYLVGIDYFSYRFNIHTGKKGAANGKGY